MPQGDALEELLQKARAEVASKSRPAAYESTAGEDITPRLFPAEIVDPNAQSQFVRENQQGNIPFDIKSGAPWTERFAASFRRDPEEVVKYWQGKYGPENVRLTSGGDLIIRSFKDKNQPKDILVDESNFTIKDLNDLAGSMPEVAGTIASIWAAKKIPGIGPAKGLPGFGRDVAAGAAGTFAGGTIAETLARAGSELESERKNIMDVASNRAKYIPFDAGADVAGAIGTKVLGKVVSPFYKKNQLTEDALEAQKWFKENLGLDYPLTAGQRTGSPFLQRLEAGQELKPGASGVYKEIRAQQNQALNEAMNVAQGLPQKSTAEQAERTVPTIDTLLRRVRHAVQKDLEPLEQGVEKAREKLVTEANRDILNEISAATIPQRQVDRIAVGDAIRGAVEARRKDFLDENARLYGATRQLPGGTDRILATPNLAKRAQEYLDKEIAGAEITSTIPTGLVDEFGKPLTREVTESVPAKNFIPSDVLGRLQELAKLGSGRFSLEDLKSMRNDVSNAIAVGESIPGVKTHHLKEIYGMLTEGMDDAVNSIPDPRLKAAWQKANKHYKDNVNKYHTRLISTILKPADAPGSIGSKEIIDRLVRGEDKLLEIRDFLGAKSPEYGMLKRNIADSMFEDAFDIGKNTINAKDFLVKMQNFRKDNRQAFIEVFGPRAANIFSIAQSAAVGQADKLDAAMIEQGIRNPSQFPNLLTLVKAERARDKAYKNDILKAIGSKSFPGENFNASDFVTRFIRSSSAAEIKPALDAIKDEGLLWQVRAKTVEDLLQEVSRHPTATDRVKIRMDPRRTINTGKLQEIFNNRERREVLETVLGKEKMELLERMGRLVKPGEAQHQTFKTASSLAVGGQIAELEKGGIIPFIGGAARGTLEALFLTWPGTRHFAGNTVATPARQHWLIKQLLRSEPFLASATDEFGLEKAMSLIGQAEDRADKWLRAHYEGPQAETLPGTNDARALRVLKQLQSQ